MSKKIKLAILVPTLRFGGGERVAANLINGLSRFSELEIVVFVYDEKQIDYDVASEILIVSINEPTDIHIFLPKISSFIRKIFKIRRQLKKHRVDIALSIMPSMNLLLTLSFLKVKKIITVHNIIRERQSYTYKIISMLQKVFYRQADKVIAVSQGVKQSLLRLEPSLEIEVIYNPLNLEEIKEKSNEKIKENIGKYIIGVGRLTEQKGFDLLVKAFSKLSNKNLNLVIIGDGVKKDELEKQVNNLGLEKRVFFLGFNENPYKYMKNSECFVLSSRWEGFGLVLAEAMATGAKVVSFDCKSGPAEIVSSEEIGSLAEAENVVDLVSKIEMRLSTESDLIKVKERINEFEIKTVSEKYYNLISGKR
jgi:glycosyltransferase involved in cell wall biosynthesis